MNTGHVSEMEWQQYVSDKFACSKETIVHIEACESCQAGIAAYRLLFAELEKLPRPSFDFDVAALLLPQLATGLPAFAPPLAPASLMTAGPGSSRADRSLSYWMAGLILLVTGIPVYLLRKNIFYVFTGVSSLFLLVSLSVAVFVLMLRTLFMYKQYRRRMRALRFY
jgi:hypothetical protein